MKKYFCITGIVGVGVIAMSLVLGTVNPSAEMVQGLPSGFKIPVIALEFSTSPEDIATLFGSEKTVERSSLAVKFDKGSYLDFAYMAMYSLFLCMVAYGLHTRTHETYYLAPLLLSPIILCADFCENLQLFRITANIDSVHFGDAFTLLQICTWIKWGALALYFVLISRYLFKRNILGKITGALSIATLITATAAFIHRSGLNEAFVAMIGILFMLLIVESFVIREEKI